MIQYYSELNQLKIADFVCELNWMFKKHSSNEKQLYWANSAEKKELGQSKKRVHKKPITNALEMKRDVEDKCNVVSNFRETGKSELMVYTP